MSEGINCSETLCLSECLNEMLHVVQSNRCHKYQGYESNYSQF